MAVALEKIANEALSLSAKERAFLVEKLLASVVADVVHEVEKAHLDEIEKRRNAVKSGEAWIVDGAEGMKQARSEIRE